jgi:hypothetical protein
MQIAPNQSLYRDSALKDGRIVAKICHACINAWGLMVLLLVSNHHKLQQQMQMFGCCTGTVNKLKDD